MHSSWKKTLRILKSKSKPADAMKDLIISFTNAEGNHVKGFLLNAADMFDWLSDVAAEVDLHFEMALTCL